MTGDRRVEVALAAYKLLGNLAHKESLPYLLAGLYPRRSSQKPRFVTGEVAAEALRNYPIEDRLATVKAIKDFVLPAHIGRLVEGIPGEDAYTCAVRLYESKLLYDDWSEESGLAFLLRLDQDRAWELVERKFASGSTVYSFTVFRDFFPNVNLERKMVLIDYVLKKDGDLSAWELPRVLDALSTFPFPGDFVLETLSRLKDVAQRRIRKWDEREAFVQKLEQAEMKVLTAPKEAKKK